MQSRAIKDDSSTSAPKASLASDLMAFIRMIGSTLKRIFSRSLAETVVQAETVIRREVILQPEGQVVATSEPMSKKPQDALSPLTKSTDQDEPSLPPATSSSTMVTYSEVNIQRGDEKPLTSILNHSYNLSRQNSFYDR